MRVLKQGRLFAGLLAAAALLGLLPQQAHAQFPPFGSPAGVIVDTDGVLRTQMYQDPSGQLTRQRVEAAKASLNADIARRSSLRKISLNRLEAALDAQLAAGQQPSADMVALAGLTRIKHVFFYPETGDIVLAGPAEGWVEDISGRLVGMETGRSIIQLDDLVTALRAFPPGQQGGPVIGCSIDPTQDGLVRMQEFLRGIGGRATPNDTQYIVDGLRTSLGLQQVRVMGVPPDTHFAQVMVEADYRMKLIGIGLEAPPTNMVTFIDRATPTSANALIRWYFVPNYECVKVAEDELAMELVGDGVKLVGEDEVVLSDGQRRNTGVQGNAASRAFTASFTSKYPEIAARSPVYAQLRNLIDLSIAAAFIQQHDFCGQAGWQMSTLLSEDRLPVQTYQSPVQVETTVNSVWKGSRLLTPVAGGVTFQAVQALKAENLLADDRGNVAKARAQVDFSGVEAGQWWWD